MVPPLRGAHGYKEAGAYVLQNCRRKANQIGNRVHRFPFIEPDEPFATGDGTVHYMVSCPAIPGELLRDNPAVTPLALSTWNSPLLSLSRSDSGDLRAARPRGPHVERLPLRGAVVPEQGLGIQSGRQLLF